MFTQAAEVVVQGADFQQKVVLMRNLGRFRSSFLYILLAALPGCGDSPVAPPVPVATVQISRDTATLVPGASITLAATPLDKNAKPLTRPIVWTSSADSIATVVLGKVVAHRPGIVTISAASEGVAAKLNATVIDGGVFSASGASITSAGGTVTVTVPAAAVSDSAQLFIESAVSPPASPRLVAGTAYRLSSSSSILLPFALSIRYEPEKLVTGAPAAGLKLYFLSDGKWQRVSGSTVDVSTHRVNASVSTLGTYAVLEQAAAVATLNVGSGQSAVVGSAVAVRPSIKVIDADELPVPGLSVQFTVTSGGGSISGGTAVTGANGVATSGDWTLGTMAGANVVSATIQGASGGPFLFSATALPGNAAKLLYVRSPTQSVRSGSALPEQPAVQLADQYGNLVKTAGVAVTVSIASGGGTISGTTTASTDASGIASFANLSLQGSVGARTLSFASPGLTSTSLTITLLEGDPASIQSSAGDGQSGGAGEPIGISPSVVVRDANNNPIGGVTVYFTPLDSSGTVATPTSTTNEFGVAKANQWILGEKVGTQTLVASTVGITTTVSFSVNVVPGPPATISVIRGDGQSVPAGRGVQEIIYFRVFDRVGNGVPNVQVNFAVTSGNGSLRASSFNTFPNGVAALPGWTLGRSTGTQTVVATVSGLPSKSATATVNAVPIKIVTFGDSNTDYGYLGTSSIINSISYVSSNPNRQPPSTPNNPTQVAGKVETFWTEQYSPAIVAVNHGILGSTSGEARSSVGAPGARTVVNGVTRFGAEVLGLGNPWNGGEPQSSSYVFGPITRVQAFKPTPNDFAYVSIGTNDGGKGITATQTIANLTWMIDTWVDFGNPASHFILTTLPPLPGATSGVEGEVNRNIRALATQKGVPLIDIAAYTSNNDGVTWKSPELHVGDGIHYSEAVRDWIASRIVAIMGAATVATP